MMRTSRRNRVSLSPAMLHYFQVLHPKTPIACGRVSQRPTYAELHNLRVHLKRMLFLRKLYERYSLVSTLELFRPYQKMFLRAGALRQAQVHARLLRKHFSRRVSLKAEFRKLALQEQKQFQYWKNRIDRYLMAATNNYSKIEEALRACPLDANQYAADLERTAVKRFTGKLHAKRLHKGRKLLKEILFSLELHPTLKKRIRLAFNEKAVLLLEDAIGDWHDLSLLLAEVGQNRIKVSSADREKVKAKQREKRKKIESLVPKIFR